ncbi:hypothetical protein V1514DRAFT_319257 [Lipomyces japonicus]|uniref:uncharacterized protein n=1 Tax=Lipomyces japonicus TaxID=56871 RepID=UPI0034CF321A
MADGQESLYTISLDILRLALSVTTGVARFRHAKPSVTSTIGEPSVYALQPKEQRITDLYNELRQLQRQLLPFEQQDAHGDFASLSLDDLREESDAAKNLADIHALVDYGSLTSVDALVKSQKKDNDANDLLGAHEPVDPDKSVQIVLQLGQQLHQLKENLVKLEIDNEAIHKVNRRLTSTIIEKKSRQQQNKRIVGQHSERIKELQQILQTVTEKIETLKPTILGLILASGIDWGNDDRLRNIVLDCSNDYSNTESSDNDEFENQDNDGDNEF